LIKAKNFDTRFYAICGRSTRLFFIYLSNEK
jgi:hypothetical protein